MVLDGLLSLLLAASSWGQTSLSHLSATWKPVTDCTDQRARAVSGCVCCIRRCAEGMVGLLQRGAGGRSATYPGVAASILPATSLDWLGIQLPGSLR